MFSFFDSRDKTAVMAKRMKYFTNSGETFLVISCLPATIIHLFRWIHIFPSSVPQ